MEIIRKRCILNDLYAPLEQKRAQLVQGLSCPMFVLSSGFYNGHYHETPEGGFQMDCYPIPVVTVEGLCDIEIDFDGVSVSTRRKRQDALEYPFERLEGRTFQAYGAEDYLATYYRSGMSFADMRRNIARSGEQEIEFSFSFPFAVDGNEMLAFAQLLKREGFYF